MEEKMEFHLAKELVMQFAARFQQIHLLGGWDLSTVNYRPVFVKMGKANYTFMVEPELDRQEIANLLELPIEAIRTGSVRTAVCLRVLADIYKQGTCKCKRKHTYWLITLFKSPEVGMAEDGQDPRLRVLDCFGKLSEMPGVFDISGIPHRVDRSGHYVYRLIKS